MTARTTLVIDATTNHDKDGEDSAVDDVKDNAGKDGGDEGKDGDGKDNDGKDNNCWGLYSVGSNMFERIS